MAKVLMSSSSNESSASASAASNMASASASATALGDAAHQYLWHRTRHRHPTLTKRVLLLERLAHDSLDDQLPR